MNIYIMVIISCIHQNSTVFKKKKKKIFIRLPFGLISWDEPEGDVWGRHYRFKDDTDPNGCLDLFAIGVS